MKNKIAFVDHNFHKKSRSGDFLRKIFKKNYLIKDFWWSLNEQYQLINKIKDYNNFFFFQSLLPLDDMIKIRDKNIIWAPMYDNLDLSDLYWRKIKYLNIKVLSFSKPVKEMCLKHGCKNISLKYALKNLNMKSQLHKKKKLKIFFWFRKNFFTKDWIYSFNQKDIGEIVYFSCPDPGVKPEVFDIDIKKKFNFTIIKKPFLHKKEYLELIKDTDVYICPRKQEGIGMSFLEALSMGKYIVANDDSTMNEYVTNNKIGFLINENIKNKVDIKKIRKFKNYRIENSKLLFEKWSLDKVKIINFFRKKSSNKSRSILTETIFISDFLKKLKFKIKNLIIN